MVDRTVASKAATSADEWVEHWAALTAGHLDQRSAEW